MDLREYARVLFKRGWVVVLIAVIGAVGAYGFSKLQQPIYSSTIPLQAQPTRPSDLGQTLAIKNQLELYSQQLQTKTIAQQVINELQLDISPEKFVSYISISANEATYQLQIQAKDPEPSTAAKMAQQLAEDFVIQHQQYNLQLNQDDRILVSIMDPASPPEIYSPKTRINVAAGGILGGLVGVLAIFVLEYIQSAYVRTTDDVERYLGLTVLGAIPTMTNKEALSEQSVPARRWFWQRA